MDTSCAHRCTHQRDGKCRLADMAAAFRPAVSENCTDCPHYTRRGGMETAEMLI